MYRLTVPFHGASQAATAAAHHTHLQSDGLWFLALGALMLIGALIAAGPPRGLDGMRMAQGRTNERIAWSLKLAGTGSVITGSILLLIGNFPTDWVLWVSGAAVVLILGIGWVVSGRRVG
jgi:hypothetical protein